MRRVLPTSIAIAIFLSLLVTLGQSALRADLGPEDAEFTYSKSSDSLIVSFQEIFGELAAQDPTPLIRVFGDGRVLVHYPDYMKRAGDYEVRLEPEELLALIQSLVTKGLAAFDSAAIHSQRQSEVVRWRTEVLARGEPSTFVFVADASVSVFELNLESYRPSGSSGLTQAGISRKISWQGLANDAKQFVDIEALGQLHAAELDLRDLLEHEGLSRLGGQTP